jgi:SpoVK/Ycf46/Vps4 family AAA+-type ATPase
MTWDDLAGYSDIKKEIKETVLIPLQHPEVYDNVVKFTREHVERNRPKAILLEGPPGPVRV